MAKSKIARRTVSLDDEIARLEGEIRQFERSYGLSSGQMLADSLSGALAETPEIAKWLSSCRVLEQLNRIRAIRQSGGVPTTTT